MHKTKKFDSKKKYSRFYTLRDIYKSYKAKFKKRKDPYNISSKLFGDICRDFNKEVSTKILEEAYFFKMPYGLGSIRIKSFKMKMDQSKLNIDFKRSIELGYTVYHLNSHTKGRAVRWKWDKINMKVPGRQTYSFIASRDNKRAISKILRDPNNNVMYFG